MESSDTAAVQTATEQALIRICSQIFDNTNIGPGDDFFALGGNSLTAIKLIEQVEKLYGEDALIPDVLFENGELRNLAREIDQAIAHK